MCVSVCVCLGFVHTICTGIFAHDHMLLEHVDGGAAHIDEQLTGGTCQFVAGTLFLAHAEWTAQRTSTDVVVVGFVARTRVGLGSQ